MLQAAYNVGDGVVMDPCQMLITLQKRSLTPQNQLILSSLAPAGFIILYLPIGNRKPSSSILSLHYHDYCFSTSSCWPSLGCSCISEDFLYSGMFIRLALKTMSSFSKREPYHPNDGFASITYFLFSSVARPSDSISTPTRRLLLVSSKPRIG